MARAGGVFYLETIEAWEALKRALPPARQPKPRVHLDPETRRAAQVLAAG